MNADSPHPSSTVASASSSDRTDPLTAFGAVRPRLFAIAYRMLGTRADADDVLQDAWLRWHQTDRAVVQSAEAWLVTIVTRLAIDRLRAAKTEREHYVGWWLPEPLVEADERTPESAAELASELSIALLWVLERLAPEERAAFLMRQAFDCDYDEIATLLGKSEAACRQMVHRATERVREQRVRFDVSKDAHRRVVERFLKAAQSGARNEIQALFADDIELVSDGGGKVPSIAKILHGAYRIANLYWATYRRLGARAVYRPARVNGEAGLLRYVDGQLESAQAFVTDGERIVAIYSVRNPDKLARIPALLR
ncbi:RNA polymerase sigma-70 factor [Trinickia caryophylli]|uniref:RNA polymerase sigma-70 factor, ECF subfamily n=1 Tax=Trinickia caryophylli TaxID=28094 RepID=A0A1X7CV64_TRICW|nr:RNA polymerase sigma-70 factor [Trinickia caryophylli]PMS13408.1 RNA polymerase sigma-70 factor [Trinickia caryophylli]TRX13731.1 RNA polymerase sigma-70 factor [Trinickia caryophylli]WQE15322.1 RNA polymerase sigma-70 factor [Trinickia caryophylli]SMF03792.1 RNA polymerase sigma-70 factor, ECF subfamily [Trinickia caryophylli]